MKTKHVENIQITNTVIVCKKIKNNSRLNKIYNYCQRIQKMNKQFNSLV